jgi:hypothetical protein
VCSSDLKDAAGLARFSLAHKKFPVRLDLDVMPMPVEDDFPPEDEEGAEDEEEEPEDVRGYRMLVTVQGPKDKSMLLSCMVTDHMRIMRVTIHETAKLPSMDTVFAGLEVRARAREGAQRPTRAPCWLSPLLAPASRGRTRGPSSRSSTRRFRTPGTSTSRTSACARAAYHLQRAARPSLHRSRLLPLPCPLCRGVDDQMCERLADYCAAKEQVEYM